MQIRESSKWWLLVALFAVLSAIVVKGSVERPGGWKGDVQFRPYTDSGALIEECPVRAVTLFELDELVELARTDGKYVVLLAGPCGECGEPKVEALRPLVPENGESVRFGLAGVNDHR